MAATFFIEDRMRKLTKKRRNNCRELEEFLQIVMETERCQSVPPSLVPTQVTCYVTKTPEKERNKNLQN